MLSKSEIVWRHLLAAAVGGKRRHASLSAVASELGLGISTAHKALADPVRVGAVVVNPGGGVRLVDPFRLAVLWAGRRRLDRDVNATWQTSIPAPEAERRFAGTDAILGGFGAVVARLGGNTIADYDTVIVYSRDPNGLRRVAPEERDGRVAVMVAEPDPLLARYGRVTPLHQAWADLFALKDWQSARFTDAVASRWLAEAA